MHTLQYTMYHRDTESGAAAQQRQGARSTVSRQWGGVPPLSGLCCTAAVVVSTAAPAGSAAQTAGVFLLMVSSMAMEWAVGDP